MKSVLMAFSFAALFGAAGSQACGPDGKQASSAPPHDGTASVAKSDTARVAKTQPPCAGSDCSTQATVPACDSTNCNVAKPALAVQADAKGKVAAVSTR